MKTYNYPLTREIANSETIRNAAVTVRPAEISPIPGVYVDGYEIIAGHECWTGHTWLPIVNREEAFNENEAFAFAAAFVTDLKRR